MSAQSQEHLREAHLLSTLRLCGHSCQINEINQTRQHFVCDAAYELNLELLQRLEAGCESFAASCESCEFEVS